MVEWVVLDGNADDQVAIAACLMFLAKLSDEDEDVS